MCIRYSKLMKKRTEQKKLFSSVQKRKCTVIYPNRIVFVGETKVTVI